MSNIFQPRLLQMLLVNSGRFDYAIIDVDKSMHFHGGNNAGKTTIVNALQFLFVDSFKSMVWTPKNRKETREYYFKSNSYIVFEVSTPTGNQCMVVIGKGAASSNEFERWIYPGSLDPEQFLEDGKKVKDSASVKSYIDSMNGSKMDDKKMRQWLTGRGDSPFGVAPLKRAKDFPKYRQVFTNLLRMKKLSPSDIRELIISSSDVFKEEITLAENFQDEFDRYKGKLQSITKLDDARETLDIFLEAYDELLNIRRSYFESYHLDRPILSKLIDSYRTQVNSAKTELGLFDTKLVELQENKELARDNWVDKNTHHLDLNTEKENLEKHLNEVRKLNQIEITMELSSVGQKITDLSIGLDQSSDSNLKNDLAEIHRKIASCKSQLEGNTTLKRELLAKIESIKNEDSSIALKMINPEILDLGEGFFHFDDGQFSSELKLFLNMFNNQKFELNGIQIDLSTVVTPALIKTVEELKSDIITFQRKEKRLSAAMEAKENLDKKRIELGNLKSQQVKLETNLNHILKLNGDENKLQSLHASLKSAQEELDKAKERESKIDNQIIELVGKRSDQSNLILNKNQAINDIEERLPKILSPKDDWHPKDLEIAETEIENDEIDWRGILVGLERKANSLRIKEVRLWDTAERIHTITEGQFRDSDLRSIYYKIQSKLDSLGAEKEALKELRESLEEDVKGEIRDFLDSFDQVKKTIRSINRELEGVRISDLDYFRLEEYPINIELRNALESARQQTTLFSFDGDAGKMDLLFERGKIGLDDLFEVTMKVAIGDRKRTLTNIGEGESTGTNLSLLLCIHIAILKYMTTDHRGRLPIFIDEVEKLDDQNLIELVVFCESSGFQVITASPRPTEFIEINYWLNRNSKMLTQANKANWSENDE